MEATIKIEVLVGDDVVLDDIVKTIETVLPYMGDNVTVTVTSEE